MVKSRLSSIDILSLITSFNIHPSPTQPHFRLANIYSTSAVASSSSSHQSQSPSSNRHYLLKLGHSQAKLVINIESGRRIHETLYKRNKEKIPNQFCLRLRKFIKGRRLESINQIGLDRVIYFDFGGYFLVMEFFAKGNIILTDENWKILTLLRKHDKGEEDVKYAVGETYPVELRKQFQPISGERLNEALHEFKDQPNTNLLWFLNRYLDYGPDIVLHCLLKAGLTKKTKLAEFLESDEKVKELTVALQEADRIVLQLQENTDQEGFIFLSGSSATTTDGTSPVASSLNETPLDAENNEITTDISKELRKRYDTFHPIIFEQYKKTPYIHFKTYNRAVDEYFSAMEQQRVDNQKHTIEKTVEKRLDKIKQEQKDKVHTLETDVEDNQHFARLIECNLPLVDSAIQTVSTALSQSLPWNEIEDIIDEQRDMGDSIADVIRKFNFNQNLIGVLLSNPLEPEIKPCIVWVDVTKSAYANVEDYFNKKKRANYKKEKTLSVQEKALKIAEEKSKERIMQAHRLKADVTKIRKTFWFEKFNWFITSENYLVVSGRDAQQNELIVRRHLRKGDIYVHADIHGAASCIVKNPNPSQPIPQLSIDEACNYCVCRSKAWDAKLGGTSAWWVYDDQVSKTAPTGEYLPTGSFMVRGKKNYVAHCPLIMGFGVLFRVSDDDVKKHIGERQVRGAGEGGDLESPATLTSEYTESELGSAVSITDDTIFDQKSDMVQHPNSNSGGSSQAASSGSESAPSPDVSEDEQQQIFQQESHTEETVAGGTQDQDGPVSVLDKLKKEYDQMTNAEKKRTFNTKDKKKLKQLMKKGDDESAAIQKVVVMKLEKMDIQRERDADNDKEPEESQKEIAARKKKQKQANKRAKKTKKQKKIASKLNEMDDEDKARMRALLGVHRPTVEEQKSEKAKKVELVQQEQRRRKREEQRLKEFFDRENIPYMTEEERKNVKEIDTLTARPHKDDTILFAVPVCAPYRIMKNYKFHFKLTPGSGKRGKIAKILHQAIQKQCQSSENESEIEALKRLSNDEMVLSLISNAQIASSRKKK
uniref:NFACT RNA-binding domain-containing protein n=1 Tax=Percolomonas cosmopolitus TaxID=63605 RepID=A0A7S1KQB1_9EUKA